MPQVPSPSPSRLPALSNRPVKPMILALDANAAEAKTLKSALRTARFFADKMRWRLRAATQVGSFGKLFPSTFTALWTEDVDAREAESARAKLADLGFAGEDAIVELAPETSSSVFVDAIAARAAELGAAAIAIVAHLRKKPAVAFPGGFAERLIARSRVPVLALNATAPPVSRVRVILAPLDLSATDRSAFKRAVEAAAAFDAKLVFFYHLLSPADPNLAYGAGLVGGIEQLDGYLKEAEVQARADVEALAKTARENGARAETLFSRRVQRHGDAIITAARTARADMIVMGTHATGAAAAAFFGGTAREVLIKAQCPVLFVHDA